MSIQMNPPVLHHIHKRIVFIEKNANRMTFRGNARIFSIQTRSWTAILGRREYFKKIRIQYPVPQTHTNEILI